MAVCSSNCFSNNLETPASTLFANFDAVAKQVTLLHYTDDHDLDCDASTLRPVESAAQTESVSAAEVLRRRPRR